MVIVAVVLGLGLARILADRHRRRVPDEAWDAAGVSRLFWGSLGVNIYVPLANVYYLLRIRPRLDAATADLPCKDDQPGGR
ncbi:MAG TPA: hypothetical protein VN088_11595 [Nocardioides sp.]|nr:hypothetical protein [Nocardioides sp.]